MLRIIAHETKRLTRVNSVFTDVTDVLWDVTSRHVTYLERNKGNSYENWKMFLYIRKFMEISLKRKKRKKKEMRDRKRLHKKRVQLPQDWFRTPTWPPFHCFGTPIWPPWRHVKTLYTLTVLWLGAFTIRKENPVEMKRLHWYHYIHSNWNEPSNLKAFHQKCQKLHRKSAQNRLRGKMYKHTFTSSTDIFQSFGFEWKKRKTSGIGCSNYG